MHIFMLSVAVMARGSCGNKKYFTTATFSALFAGKRNTFLSSYSHPIMLDTVNNKFNGSSFQFETDTERKKNVVQLSIARRQLFNFLFKLVNEGDLNFSFKVC